MAYLFLKGIFLDRSCLWISLANSCEAVSALVNASLGLTENKIQLCWSEKQRKRSKIILTNVFQVELELGLVKRDDRANEAKLSDDEDLFRADPEEN